MLANSNYEVIALTETFLTSSVCDGELFPVGYSVLRRDRVGDCGWGGVLIAVRAPCSLRLVSDIEGLAPDKEVLFAVVGCKNYKFLCVVVYLPPNYRDDQYLSVLTCIENAVIKYSSSMDIVVLGDFNPNSLSNTTKEQLGLFVDFCNFAQHCNVINDHGGILDLVLSGLTPDRINVLRAAEPLVPIDRYHPPLAVYVTMPSPTRDSPQYLHGDRTNNWNFRGADLAGLYVALGEMDWSELLAESDVNAAVGVFYNALYSSVKAYVPNKKPSRSPGKYIYPKWFNADIIYNIRQKHYHLKMYKSDGKEFNRELFRYYRQRVKHLIGCARAQHLGSIQKSILDRPATFWKYVKELRSSRQQDNVYSSNGIEVTGQDAADAFSRYFGSVFLNNEPKLCASEAIVHALPSAAHVTVDSLDADDISAAAKRLKARASTGPDGIPAFLVKDCISVLKIPLLHIYNLSLDKAMYPEMWKTSRVTPVSKVGSSSEVSDFRPIAVLSVFAKLFESMLERQVSQQVRCFLDDSQHGFRRFRSTTTNHINLVDYVMTEMDEGRQVDAAYFDFRKAFDLVDNDILLQKCAAIGFSTRLLEFFADYLRNRKQFVSVGGFESDYYYTRSGVSQGSTLGPTLFLLMINDLSTVVGSSKCFLFADDLKLCLGVKSRSDAEILQRDIDSVTAWSTANGLSFNSNKCKVMTFTRSRSPVEYEYCLNHMALEKVSKFRDLGLILDAKLDFHDHILNICKSASKTLGFIMRVASQFKGVTVAKVLYNAYVRSKLEYGAVVWDPYEGKYILLLERIQRRFTRWIYKRSYGYYPYMYPSLFVSGMVGLDTLEFRRRFLLVVHYIRLLHNEVDNPEALGRMSFMVPKVAPVMPPRRPPRLLARPTARTNRSCNAPSSRAVEVLGDMLAQYREVDIFADSFRQLVITTMLYLNYRLTKG